MSIPKQPTERFGIRLDKQYFNFGSAHFLIFADGSREELHGHNYRATLGPRGRRFHCHQADLQEVLR